MVAKRPKAVIQPFSYTGREYDDESGLYFYRARYFDANTGRFLSEDPIRFRAGDQNFYRYVRNNPLNNNDPFGLQGAATNPGGAIGDLPGMINNLLRGRANDRIFNDVADVINELESNLEPGVEAEILIIIDPLSKRILDVVPSPRFVDPNNDLLELPVKLRGPNNSPLCNTCPCKP